MKCLNARITATKLGGYDGGTSMLGYWISLTFDVGGVVYGGHLLGHDIKGEVSGAAADILDVLKTVGVASWEELKGSYVRA